MGRFKQLEPRVYNCMLMEEKTYSTVADLRQNQLLIDGSVVH